MTRRNITTETLPRLPIFEALSSHNPKSTAIIHSESGENFTYGSLLSDTAKLKRKLLENAKTDNLQEQRMAFLVENGYNYVVSLLGIFAAGGIAVPLNPGHPPKELHYVVNNSTPTFILTTPNSKAHQVFPPSSSFPPILDFLEHHPSNPQDVPVPVDLSPAVDPSRGALMIYTSGTTAAPKGVVSTHKNLTTQATTLVTAWEMGKDDHLLHVLPLHHVHGIVNATLAPLFSGGTVEYLFPFNTQKVWSRFADTSRKPISLFMAVPTIYSRLIESHETLPEPTRSAGKKAVSSLRLAISGSAALPANTKQKWESLGGNLLERYGMTEIGMALSQRLPLTDRMANSVGWPLPGVEARLVGDGVEITKVGQEGEIQIRGDNVFREYWQKEEATKKEFTDDRWFKTGDVAVRDERGAYYIKGRASVDIIKSGGEKISALEVERELLELPQVAEVAVVGLSDKNWGQRVAAVLMLTLQGKNEEFDLVKMRAEMKKRVADYKVPREIKILEAIPRNQMGKVNKKELVRKVFAVDGRE
ncbi:acetyl-CoA synthetase-like protein [Choiromyces venosus 120613-1]|uniref:Acetyl-CoA synthetase-like protein n=1 Tax=Choiromyces venosus 120613-1 TaxID=1336337 RepID=A0A3N4J2Z5_9PEZI|nr:acetyl-CoA synthetase-like protein [Choiromyces venosus 120613-1]